ncbi:hypothetical protein LINPERPRIM_LOCUS31797 [Linum perenne]
MLTSGDKRGGAPFSCRQNQCFIDYFNSCDLSDPKVIGPMHTWYRGLTSERIDKMLLNSSWKLQFPFSTIWHLARIYSNHRPILLSCADINRNQMSRPFWLLGSATKASRRS